MLDLLAVTEGLVAVLEAADFVAYGPTDNLSYGCCVAWPDEVEYDVTAGGICKITLPVNVLVPFNSEADAHVQLSPMISGDASVISALRGARHAAWRSIRIANSKNFGTYQTGTGLAFGCSVIVELIG